ncbi:MAG TPA: hypothetical protein VHO70_05345 [Chitinispirillaceae bacterium]|nr:hypothetical protein [Chitinispirillaceae bacterium]
MNEKMGILLIVSALVVLAQIKNDSIVNYEIEKNKQVEIADGNGGPPSGNSQFWPGFGLTIAGAPVLLIGLLSFNQEPNKEKNDLEYYGEIYSGSSGSMVKTQAEIDKERRQNRVFGIVLMSCSGVFEAVGLPLLVLGNKKRNIRKKWEKENKITFHTEFSGSYYKMAMIYRF